MPVPVCQVMQALAYIPKGAAVVIRGFLLAGELEVGVARRRGSRGGGGGLLGKAYGGREKKSKKSVLDLQRAWPFERTARGKW